MRNALFLLLMLIVTPASLLLAQGINPGAALPKPDIKMKDVGGSLVSLGEVKTDAGLLVMFSSNTCPYVVKNQDRIRNICKLANDKGIGVIILNANEGGRNNGESLADMQTYAKQQRYECYYALDSDNEIADAFGAMRTPECFLFDKNGKLVYHGAIDDSPADPTEIKRNHLQMAINEMTTGKQIAMKQSRAVGCSIRRRGN